MFPFISTALASTPCDVASGLIANGCQMANAPGVVNTFIVTVSGTLILSISALCVLLVVWGGTLMAFSYGDESRVTKGRNSILYAMLGFAIALLSQTIVNYAAQRAIDVRSGNDGTLILNAITEAILVLTDVFNMAVIFVLIIGGFRYAFSRGNTEQADGGRKMVQWAVIGGICVNLAKIAAELVLNLGL